MQESKPSSANGDRNLASIVSEIRDEVRTLLTTRIEMLKSEVRESGAAIKAGVPIAVLAAVLLGTGYLLFTLAVVGLVAVAFAGSPYRWFFSFLIVGFVWFCTGGMATLFALHRFRQHGLFPKKTVEVLKADKVWIQNEIRGSI